jgi:hypothetical protein
MTDDRLGAGVRGPCVPGVLVVVRAGTLRAGRAATRT